MRSFLIICLAALYFSGTTSGFFKRAISNVGSALIERALSGSPATDPQTPAPGLLERAATFALKNTSIIDRVAAYALATNTSLGENANLALSLLQQAKSGSLGDNAKLALSLLQQNTSENANLALKLLLPTTPESLERSSSKVAGSTKRRKSSSKRANAWCEDTEAMDTVLVEQVMARIKIITEDEIRKEKISSLNRADSLDLDQPEWCENMDSLDTVLVERLVVRMKKIIEHEIRKPEKRKKRRTERKEEQDTDGADDTTRAVEIPEE